MNGLFDGKCSELDVVDSTNDRLKELAAAGAPEGTVLLARGQTAGRGTSGRAFWSPAGEGLYLSVLLRPAAPPEELLTLTGRAAAAVRRGIASVSGAPCTIKWLNDIYLGGYKVCGILTELSPCLDWAVLGIGVNLTQRREDFEGAGLTGIATSLAAEGYPADRRELAAGILAELEHMYRDFPGHREKWLAEYRAHCDTVGRPVRFWADGGLRTGRAAAIEDDFTLAADSEGRRYTVSAGAVELI